MRGADAVTVSLQEALDAVKDAVYEENSRGGEARLVVASIAQKLGVDLSRDPLNGEKWSPVNMNRVVLAVEKLKAELAEAKQAGRVAGPTEAIYRTGWPHNAELTWDYYGKDMRVTAKTETAEWVHVGATNGQPLWQLVEDDDWIPAQCDADGSIRFSVAFRHTPQRHEMWANLFTNTEEVKH